GPAEPSMNPLLLPSGTIKSQVYEWGGKSFAKVREEKQAPGAGPSSQKVAAGEPPRARSLPPAAHPPTADELQDQVYALYKRDRHVVSREKPRLDFAVDLAEDPRPEPVLLHGRDLVV